MSSEALRLADRITPETDWYEFDQVTWCKAAAKELRTQAARIASLEAERDQLRAEVERLRKPLTDEQVIAIKRATKAADPTQQWGDTLAFARAIEAAKEAK